MGYFLQQGRIVGYGSKVTGVKMDGKMLDESCNDEDSTTGQRCDQKGE